MVDPAHIEVFSVLVPEPATWTMAVLGLAGMGIIAAGRLGLGAMAALAGIGAAFVPNMIGTAFDATQAAPLVASIAGTPGPAAWWTPALGLLYPVLLALRLALDPVVVAAVALSRLLGRRRLAVPTWL